jgi:hypothetical protein
MSPPRAPEASSPEKIANFSYSLARAVVEGPFAEFEDKIEFDSEADVFCARSADRSVLVKLGQVLAEAARSPKPLKKLIEKVPPALWDD